MTTTAGSRRPARSAPERADSARDRFGDVVLLTTVVLFFLLAVGVGLLALQRSLT